MARPQRADAQADQLKNAVSWLDVVGSLMACGRSPNLVLGSSKQFAVVAD